MILYFSTHLRRLLGERGLTALERLILAVVAVEMMMSGIAQFFGMN